MNNKIDILEFIPKQINGFDVFYKIENIDGEQWFEVWYKHPRIKPVRLRRFIDVKILGKLLGQYQAEGTKNAKKKHRFEFCNKLVLEHKDYFDYLIELGVPREKIFSQISIRDELENLTDIIKDYEKTVGIPIDYVTKSRKQKGEYGFRTYARSTIITEIFLNCLNIMRYKMANNEWDNQLKILADAFFSKLLTGDGTLDIQIKNREYNYPSARIKITDYKLEYLKDYASIMKKLNFIPYIKEKHICVRAGCSLERLLYLYKIRAFENTNNWNKLLVLIALNLQGRRNNTCLRFIELNKLETFTSKDIMNLFNIDKLPTANDWLRNKEMEGLLVGKRRRPYAVQWSLTDRAKKLSQILLKWKIEFNGFKDRYDSTNLYEILENLKTKKISRSQPKSAPFRTNP